MNIKQTTNFQPYDSTLSWKVWSVIVSMPILIGFAFWSHKLNPFTDKSLSLFSFALTHVKDLSSLFPIMLTAVMSFLIPLVVAVFTVYWKRKQRKVRLLFFIVYTLSAALGAFIVFTLTLSKDPLFVAKPELYKGFMYSFVLVNMLAALPLGMWLGLLYGDYSLFNTTACPFLVKYLLPGAVLSVTLSGFNLLLQREFFASVDANSAYNYLGSLYAFSGIATGFIMFLFSVAFIRFMQNATQHEEQLYNSK